MPLGQEFKRHLGELMRETAEGLGPELNRHRNDLVEAARKTGNGAAVPNAYSKASIDNFRVRIRATIDRYLAALETCGIVVDAVVEREMLTEIRSLTACHPSLSFPPMVARAQNATAVQQEHAREMSRVGVALQREAANRLRELKMKASRSVPAPEPMTPAPPFTIASVAPTLAVLKALPMQEQAMLLLRRMVQIYPTVRNSDKFNKHNLTMPGDHMQLAMGFPEPENMAVREHLLGGPWTRLVMEGYLVDPRGSGFFDLTLEAFTAAEEAAKPKPAAIPHQPSGRIKLVEFENPDRPVAFMSYSWETKEHEDWVLALATRLYAEGGVNVILDKWHLRMGMQNPFFMERAVAESDFVLVVCTPAYAKKANDRSGGVGYEAMIITGELAADIQQRKFIPVLRAGGWDGTSMPRWLTARNGADLRGDPYDENQYNLLVRELHGEYLKPPAAGPMPQFSPIEHVPPLSAAPATAPAVQSIPPATPASRPQNAIAYAFYETKGPDAQYFKMYIRPVDSANDVFSLETSDGELTQGTFYAVARDFVRFDRKYVSRGYIRTHKFNGTGRRDIDIPQ